MMADDTTSAQAQQQPAKPNPALKRLDRLVGTWKVSGPAIHGQVTFEWMEGGFFLMQHVDLDQAGQRTKGIEIIGYDQESQTLKSHYFDSTGQILEYVWEVGDDTLTIWYGSVGSPAKYQGVFSHDGNINAGRWEWPGRGYESTMTRAEQPSRRSAVSSEYE